MARLDRRARKLGYSRRLDKCVTCRRQSARDCHIIPWDSLPKHLQEWLIDAGRVPHGATNVPICPKCQNAFLRKGSQRKTTEGHHFFGKDIDELTIDVDPTTHESLDLPRYEYPRDVQDPKTPAQQRARIFYDSASLHKLLARQHAERIQFHRMWQKAHTKVAARFESLGREALNNDSS